jgi:alanine dehydrogenase
MGEIAGISVVLIAAECLSTTVLGRGKLIGGITGLLPSKIVILGAGTVAEYASQAALGLGAQVTIFDRSLTKMRRLQNKIGNRVLTSVLDPATLTQELKQCDVVIGAIHSNDGRSPMIVTEEMVMQMKPGSVIVDVSIDQGGCFETSRVTTHDEPTFREYDVIHYCVPNIPSRYARTASIALSNLSGTLLSEAEEAGGLENYLWMDSGIRHGAYAFGGAVTNRYLSQKFDEPYVNLEIMARGRFS